MATSPTITRADFPSYSIIRAILTEGVVVLEKDVMAGPCRVTSIEVTNGDNAILFLRLFDDGNPENGSTAPDHAFPIPAKTDSPNKALMVYSFPVPLVFRNGLSVALVTVGGTAGSTGPTSASTVVITARPGVS